MEFYSIYLTEVFILDRRPFIFLTPWPESSTLYNKPSNFYNNYPPWQEFGILWEESLTPWQTTKIFSEILKPWQESL